MAETKSPTTIAGPPAATGDIVPKKQPPTKLTLFKAALERGADEFRRALPRHIDPMRFFRVVLTAVNTPVKAGQMSILDCSQESIFSCLMTCAQLGLEPQGPQGHAYLIPFRQSGSPMPVCTLVVGFKGLIKLARNSDEIKSVNARVVHEKDTFHYQYGLHEDCVHIPTDEEDPGPVTHAYAVWQFRDGGSHFDVMTFREMVRLRDRKGEPNGGSPWWSDPEEMFKKTVIRRSSKMVPNSIDLARGIEANDRQEDGLPPVPALETALITSAAEPAQIAEKPATIADASTKARATREGKPANAAPSADERAKEAEEKAFGGATPPADTKTPPPAEKKPDAPAGKATSEQRRQLAYLSTQKGIDLGGIVREAGAASTADLTGEQAAKAIGDLEGLPDK